MNLGLKGKRVLVTGSSKGIGLAIAKSFLSEGANVFLTSRTASDLKSLASSLAQSYPDSSVMWNVCDFTNRSEIEALFELVNKQWGSLDIVVSNIGDGSSVPDPISSAEQFSTVMAKNFEVGVNTARVFYPLLKESFGNILFISSIAGVEAFGAPVDYSVAKTAILSFSKNLSRKAAVDGIRVNSISPGNIYFKGGTWDEKQKENPDKVENILKTQVPMQRFGTPEEVANAVLFLCSEKASFITGANLIVDGGQTVTLF